jgi:polysaccharide biosynthesis protein PslF
MGRYWFGLLLLFVGTLIMAMGMGLPCVSTPYPFAVEALASGRGVLVPFREAGVLANAISYVLEDEERAREMGKAAQKYAVSWDAVAQKFINLLNL